MSSPSAIGPALAEALVVTSLLTLGGVVPLPRAVVCIGAGAVLGWTALLPTMLGSAFGATLGFLLARFVLSGPIRRFVSRRPGIGAVLNAVEAEGWRVLGLLRLGSPVPGPAINFACGASAMKFREYIVTSLLGLLPQTVFFVDLGRSGSAALASRSLRSLDGLTVVLGLVLTSVALWRLKVAIYRQSARMMSGTPSPAAGAHGTEAPSPGRAPRCAET